MMRIVDLNESIKNYIFLEENNKIFRINASLYSDEASETIEKYISTLSPEDFKVKDKDSILKDGIPIKFLQNIGKFRLDGKIRKTENYFVPKNEPLFTLLISKYKDYRIKPYDLKNLNNEYLKGEKTYIINELCSNICLDLIDVYTLDEIKTTIDLTEKFENIKEIKEICNNLKWVLTSAKENKEFIKNLGLEKKVTDKINKYSDRIYKLTKKHN